MLEGCPECNGRNKTCKTCHGTDEWTLHECPRKTVDPRAMTICHYVDGAYARALPVAGGMLQQCASFVAALRFATMQRNDMLRPKDG